MNNPSKIKVLHLRDSPWVCGPGRTVLDTGSIIDSERFDYLIGAFCKKYADENPFVAAASEKGLTVFEIQETFSSDLRVIFQILKIMDKHNINILHSHEVRSDIFGLICARLRHIPSIAIAHGWIENGWKGRLFSNVDRYILRFFDHIIAVSSAVEKQLLSAGIKGAKISVLHNSLTTDKYFPNDQDFSLREEFGIDRETFVVGNIGRLSPEKGQKDFLLAAKDALSSFKKIVFLLIGVGPDQAFLEELARNLGIEEHILFTGFRSDMQRIYNNLDLVVQSSYTEGLPNVVLEALLMAVPVIATDVGGTSEIIENGTTGILVSPGNPKELADKILECIENRDHMKTIARQGRMKVQKEFDLQQRTQKLTKIYETLMICQSP